MHLSNCEVDIAPHIQSFPIMQYTWCLGKFINEKVYLANLVHERYAKDCLSVFSLSFNLLAEHKMAVLLIV